MTTEINARPTAESDAVMPCGMADGCCLPAAQEAERELRPGLRVIAGVCARHARMAHRLGYVPVGLGPGDRRASPGPAPTPSPAPSAPRHYMGLALVGNRA